METIEPLGRFSLRAAAAFGFGPTEGRPPTFDGALRLAFCVDGGRGYAGAVLRQREDDGPVGVELTLRDGAPRRGGARAGGADACRWTTTARRSRTSATAIR